jgi:hypothetical protein
LAGQETAPEHVKNATIEAKLESTQEPITKEVTSRFSENSVDDQTQFAPSQGDASWDKTPILSSTSEHHQGNDTIGIVSHDGDLMARE